MINENAGRHRGDDGSSGLIGGMRRSKADPVFHCLGWLDELNAAIGALRVTLPGHSQPASTSTGTAGPQPGTVGSQPRGRLDRELRSIQMVLGRLMGAVAAYRPDSQTATDGESSAEKEPNPATTVTPEDVALLEAMEHEILVATDVQPRFYVPGDSTREAAVADIARARCRTAERAFIDYLSSGNEATGFPVERIPEHFVHGRRFLNRLSDYLFALARYLDGPQE